MAKVELKQPVVNEIKELLTDAQSAVLVSYRGITVEQDTAMRKELREAARILAKHAKNIEVLEMKSGVVEGTFYDKDGIQVIASIPSRDELLAKFLGSIQSPITNFARVIKQIAEKDGEGAAAE